MIGNKGWFLVQKKVSTKTVKLGNDMTMKVVAKGSVRMQVDGVTQIISNVYFVPELKNNLLNLGQLQEIGLTILIQNRTCKVFHYGKGIIMQTNMSRNRMFYVLVIATPKKTMCLQTEIEIEKETHLWNCRFGHLNHKGLNTLSKNQSAHQI